MLTIDLEHALSKPQCPICKATQIRPCFRNNGSLIFRCSNRRCKWQAKASLPKIRKTLVYLDTSIVSHISRAQKSSPWIKLYNTLREAAAREVICCPGSSVVEDEAELADSYKQIREISIAFSEPDLKSVLDVSRTQQWRAFERFMNGTPPLLELNPPLADAFNGDPHEWGPDFLINISRNPIAPLVEDRCNSKAQTPTRLKEIFEEYQIKKWGFKQISDAEAKSFGKSIIEEAIENQKKRILKQPIDLLSLAPFLPNEFEILYTNIVHTYDLSQDEAVKKSNRIPNK